MICIVLRVTCSPRAMHPSHIYPLMPVNIMSLFWISLCGIAADVFLTGKRTGGYAQLSRQRVVVVFSLSASHPFHGQISEKHFITANRDGMLHPLPPTGITSGLKMG